MYSFDRIIDRVGSGSSKWTGHGAIQTDSKRTLCYTTADMDFPCPPCVLDGLQKRLAHPIFGYTLPSPRLSEALCGWLERRHGLDVDPAWVKPSTGIMTALAFSLRALVRPGDRVLVFTPLYQPFFTIVESAGLQLVECPLKNTDGFYEMDFELVEAFCAGGGRAILFCNPHNPVGRVWTREELSRLTDLCLRYGVYLISDEAHADFAMFGHPYTSLAAFPAAAQRSVVCFSPNKTFNIPSVGSAYLVIRDAGLRERISSALRSAWILSPGVLNAAAAQAGFTDGDRWLDELLPYLEGNITFLRQFLSAHMPRIRPAVHEGTYLMWLDCGCFSLPSRELAPLLVDRCGVSWQDGSVYRGDGGRYLRVNIACPRRLLETGLEAVTPVYDALCP